MLNISFRWKFKDFLYMILKYFSSLLHMPLLSSIVSEDAGIEHKSWKGTNWILSDLEENNSWKKPKF